jgi:hypothetical protein
MLPMLTLGIPGSPTTAILLGGMVIWGLTPGPRLFIEQSEFVWGLIGSFYVSNVAALLINLAFIPLFIWMLRMPFTILAPMIFVLSIVGGYAATRDMFDIWMIVVFGLGAFFLRKFDYPLAPAVLAIVLGPIAEPTLRQSLLLSRATRSIFLTRPIAAPITVIAIILILLPAVNDGSRDQGPSRTAKELEGHLAWLDTFTPAALGVLAIASGIYTYLGVTSLLEDTGAMSFFAAVAYSIAVSVGIFVFWSYMLRLLPSMRSAAGFIGLTVSAGVGSLAIIAMSSWLNAAALPGLPRSNSISRTPSATISRRWSRRTTSRCRVRRSGARCSARARPSRRSRSRNGRASFRARRGEGRSTASFGRRRKSCCNLETPDRRAAAADRRRLRAKATRSWAGCAP